jgi:hypothetical protein
LKHYASPEFWKCYQKLAQPIRDLADKNFALQKTDPQHPSLHFKPIGRLYSVRVGLSHRALGVGTTDGIVWFWIGTHSEYDKLIG